VGAEVGQGAVGVVADGADQYPGEPTVEGSFAERGSGQPLDAAPEGRVLITEVLVVGQVAWPVPLVDGHHQARPGDGPADPGAGLNVFGHVLRLASDHHQPQALHVDADLQHRCGEEYIDGSQVAGPDGLV